MADTANKEQQPPGTDGEKVSKNALKKAEKAKAKADLIADKKAVTAGDAAGAANDAADAVDVSKDRYGDLPLIQSEEKVDRKLVKVKDLNGDLANQLVWLRGRLQVCILLLDSFYCCCV